MQLGTSRLTGSHEISALRMCRGGSCMCVAGVGWCTGFRWRRRAGSWGICQRAASLCRRLAPRHAARPDHGQYAGGGFAAVQQADPTWRGLLCTRRHPRARRCASPSTHEAAVSYRRRGSLDLQRSLIWVVAAMPKRRHLICRSKTARCRRDGYRTRPPPNLRVRPASGLQNPSWFRLRRLSSNEKRA